MGGEKMQDINSAMPTSEIVRNLSIQPKIQRTYDESKLLNAIREIEKIRYLPSERGTKNNVIKYAVGQWFSQRMREKYQELSPEIFELEREVEITPNKITDYRGRKIEIDDDEKTFALQIPMFVKAELGKETGWERELRINDDYKVTLFSKMPHIPSEVRQARKDALKFAYNTYADALNNDLLSEIIFENPEYAPNPANSKLLVLWKPKPSEIHAKAERIDNDPVLVLRYGKPYLVTTWKEPNEEPFMDIISACKLPNLETFLKG